MFKGNPKMSKDYGSIVNSRHAERIRRLVRDTSGEIVREGENDISSSEKFVPPTIVLNPAQSDALMREEIFGPVLPIRTFETIDEAIQIVNETCDHPLALYIFSESEKNVDHILNRTTSGGVAVNAVMEHLHDTLPFGGVGESGMGSYGGRWGFEEFSHFRAVMYKDTRWLGAGVLLPPYSPKVYEYATKYMLTGFLTNAQKRIMKAVAGLSGVALAFFLLRGRRGSRL